MCTAIAVQTPQREVYFGRTMDFSYPLDPELYFIPKGYEWKNLLNTHKIRNQYSFMGIGQDISRVFFADGVNEMGFAAAVLYFPDYAAYDPIAAPDSKGISVAAIELVGFLLGLCFRGSCRLPAPDHPNRGGRRLHYALHRPAPLDFDG